MTKNIPSRILVPTLVLCSLLNLQQKEDYCPRLIQAVEKGQLEYVKLLLDKGIDINCRGPYQQTPLIVAAKNNRLDIAKLLCERKADINAKGEFADPMVDYTPLMWAIENRNLNMAEFLVGQGADVNIPDSWGNSPLILAAKNGSLPLVRLLAMNGADSAYRTKPGGRSAIFEAMQQGDMAIVEFLAQHGDDPKSIDSNGWSLLMVAANRCNSSGVEYSLDKGVDINGRATLGTTTLHLAAKHNSDEGLAIVNSLIIRGGDIVAKDNFGETPLMVATHTGSLGVAKALLRAGANIEDHNNDGMTALHLAAKGLRSSVKEEVIKLLLEEGACINAKDNNGITPLMVAAKYANTQPISTLIKNGANPNIQDHDGWTAMMYAASENQVDNIKLLYEKGADLSKVSSKGKTALNISEESKKTKEAYILLRRLNAK